jgi:putative acetyltransferase
MSPKSSSQIEIRIAKEADLESILILFKDCVLTICRGDYSQEQLNAWASAAANIQRWKDKIKLQYFVVAHVSKKLVGFGALENKDLIDLLYVHKDCQGSGVGSKILESLVSMSRSQGIKVLKAEVSKTARHFFESNGFAVVLEQAKQIDSLVITNYQMTKALI